MGDTSPISVEHRPPEETFALLGNETRVDVLRALAAAEGPLPFSELRERVGTRDSGGFNYHLGKLAGVFVKQGEEGYELTLAGLQVVGALVAGTYTAEASMEPMGIDDPCPSCGEGSLVVSFADEQARIDCTDCEQFHNRFSFPPGTLDQYEPDELPEAFDRWMRARVGQITAGFCANCAGRLAGELRPDEEPPRIEWRCERCGDRASTSAVTPALYHPAVLGFLHDHGVDAHGTPSWRLLSGDDYDVTADEAGTTVRVSLDDETLTARIDPEGSVASVERSDR